MKNNQGTEENRERHLDYGVELSNILFEKYKTGEDIYLFSPNDVKDMTDAFYRGDFDTFNKLYEEYSKSDSVRKRLINSRTLLHSLITERQKTGRIYTVFMENFYQQSPFEDSTYLDGSRLSSNLCVAPDTLLQVKDGCYHKIKDLVGKEVEVWNGVEWSKVTPMKTGENQVMIHVVVENILTGELSNLKCTPYHKWYNYKGSELRTFQLNVGENLLPWKDHNDRQIVHRIVSLHKSDPSDTYCFTEPKRNMGVFNGILTGQCLEIGLPIKDSTLDNQGSVALCTLSSVNFGKVNKPSDLENPCRSAVRALDHLLSYQEYPVKEAENFTKKYRALGVGVVGFAHFLAKRGLKYNLDAASVVDEYMEAFMYYLIDESVELAKEYGACEGYSDTCYTQGLFPWEKRNKNIDQVVPMTTRHPWEALREKVKKYGIRNATLAAIAPTESCLKWDTTLDFYLGGKKVTGDFHDIAKGNNLDPKAIEFSGDKVSIPLKDTFIDTRFGKKEVTNLHYNGVAKTMKITLESGEVISCTMNHKFLVKDTECGELYWKMAGELTGEEFIEEFSNEN